MENTSSSLFDRQLELEEEMIGRGILRYRKGLKSSEDRGELTASPAINSLLKTIINPVSSAIQEHVNSALNTKRRGRQEVAAAALKDINPDVAALITAKVVLDGITVAQPFVATAVRIGRGIEDEARLATFDEAEPKLYRLVREDAIKRSRDRRHRTMILDYAMERVGVEWEEWTNQKRLHVGTRLLSLFSEKTGLVDVVLESKAKNRTVYVLRATDELLKWIDDRNSSMEAMFPVYMPMIVPPKPWDGPWGGGYYSPSLRRSVPIPFVKRAKRGFLEELSNRPDQMAATYTAINAIQETPWKINREVLEVAAALWDRGDDLGVLPPRDPRPVADCPLPRDLKREDMTEAQLATLIEWKVYARDIHEFNAKQVSKRVQTARILATATRFADEDAIYFPHQVDFRGRAYSMTGSTISPQGSDFSKGLLTFAEGVPIEDEAAAGWLAIHVANTFGEDKLSLEDRIEWAFAQKERIISVAEDPLADLWWTRADSPWQFLAACLEFAGLLNEGYGFVSHLPVAMDATCSGLQHFSAMTRDPVGGAAVNLMPLPERRDIYQDVADVVTSMLANTPSFSEEEQPIAIRLRQWLDTGVPRAATKRTVMVVPYAGTFTACRTYVHEWLEEAGAREVFDKSDFLKAGAIMARLVWAAVGEVVIGSKDVMRWLQTVARQAAKSGLPLVWTAPSGFPVFMGYERLVTRRVDTRLGDRVVKARLNSETGELDVNKQANAVAPNFVHACDASHLVETVVLGVDNGVTSYAMVHDSFGTHAGRSAMLATCLREAFVSMYEENNVLEQFREEVSRIAEGELPEVPAFGDLDISDVRDSDFFFS